MKINLPDHIISKIIKPGRIAGILTGEMRKNHTIVFTNGCFDLLHLGHIHILTAAKAMGDILVVGLNSDNSVNRLKGPGRPVNDQVTRETLLASLEMVDYVVIFEEDTPLNLILQVRPDVLVKGGDYTESEIVGHDFVVGYGGKVSTVPLLEGHSSTGLIGKLGGL